MDDLRRGDPTDEVAGLGYAVLGLGWFGAVLADAVAAAGAGRVVSCFARTPDTRAAFAERHGCRAANSVEAVLDDPDVDAVLIATPHTTHADLTVAAAEAGKHVFVEKPLALTVADGRRADAAAERAGVVLQVGHNRRRQPANRRIKAMIDAGELGTVLQLEGNQSVPGGFRADLPAWRSDPTEVPAGSMTALGVHVVDTFLYFAGPMRAVSAFSVRPMLRRPMDEATALIAEFESGALGYVGTSYYTPNVATVAVHGTEASAWNEQDGEMLFVQRRGERARTPVDTQVLDTISDELREFARCIRTGSRPETGAPEAIEVVAVLQAVVTSVATGATVKLADVR